MGFDEAWLQNAIANEPELVIGPCRQAGRTDDWEMAIVDDPAPHLLERYPQRAEGGGSAEPAFRDSLEGAFTAVGYATMTRAGRRSGDGDSRGAHARAPSISSVAAGRAALRAAAVMLCRAARTATFKKSYARMNPAAALSENVFYFGEPNVPRRAVIWGPYLYVDAPGVRLPPEFEPLSETYRRAKRIGALHARLHLSDEGRLKTVTELIRRLR